MKLKIFVSTLIAATVLVPSGVRFGFLLGAEPRNQGGTAEATPRKSPEAPRQVLQEFCELDLQGKQLTVTGREQVARFFVKPEVPPLKDIVIVMDCVVSEPLMKGNKAEFYVEQLMLGQLDSSLRYKPALPDEPDEPIMLRRDQSLVLTTEYSKAGPGGVERTIRGRPAWRLDSEYMPSMTVEAAISYVSHMRDTTKDKTVRENVNKTLAALAILKNVGNPYTKVRKSLTDPERQKLHELFPKQNPCPEIGSMDALRKSAKVTASEIAAAIEAEDTKSLLSLTSANGIGFMQLGDQWLHYSDLVSEFSNKTAHYCRFFDTACLKQPRQSPIAPWLPKRTYSYREWLTRSSPYETDVDLTRATGCAAAIIFVRSGNTADQFLTKDLYLQLSYESGGWRLLSIGYGPDIP